MTTDIQIDGHIGLLVYDVPTRLTKIRPPLLLRKKAARVNLSCWLITAANLKSLPIEEWRRQGANVRYAFDQAGMVMLAKDGIRSEVAQISRRLAAAVRKAEGIYELAKANVFNEDILKKADRQAYMAMRHAREALDAAKMSAIGFDFTGDFEDAFNGISYAIKAESESLSVVRSDVILHKTRATIPTTPVDAEVNK